DFAITYPRHLSEFFPTRKTLAIHRPASRPRPRMNRHASGVAVLDLEPAASDFLAEVIESLFSSPKTLPSKFFYDERGSDLFHQRKSRTADRAGFFAPGLPIVRTQRRISDWR